MRQRPVHRRRFLATVGAGGAALAWTAAGGVARAAPLGPAAPAVLWRKGSFGADSEAGSRFAERLLTVIASCRQQGRPLLEFLVAAGEAALHGTAAPSLLPAGQEG